MKTNRDLLLDIIHMRRNAINMYVQELYDSIKEDDIEMSMIYKSDIKSKEEELIYLNEIYNGIVASSDGMSFLKNTLKDLSQYEYSDYIKLVWKHKLINELIKEYKIEYKKSNKYNKKLGTNGKFDRELFCSVIKKKINKYSNCNKVTREKYKHLVAFLNEFLHEIENSQDPLKTLRLKVKLYERYKKQEYIDIRKDRKSKAEIIKEIIESYNIKKKSVRQY